MSQNGERPEWLSFKDAVAWAGVSRQRLNQAIWRGEIEAERGGPGVKARVNYDSLNRWLYARGLLTRTPETPPSTTIERLERLVERLDSRLEGVQEQLDGLQRQYDTLSGLMDAIGRSVDLAFKHLQEELQQRKDALRQAQDRLNTLEREQVSTALRSLFGSPDPEAPSTRQVGTVGSVLSLLVREGKPHSDQDVAAFLAPEGWDAGVVQRCLEQLRADGRYQQALEKAPPP